MSFVAKSHYRNARTVAALRKPQCICDEVGVLVVEVVEQGEHVVDEEHRVVIAVQQPLEVLDTHCPATTLG